MNKITHILILKLVLICALPFMTLACTSEFIDENGLQEKEVKLQLSRATGITDLQGYLFNESGNLVQKFDNINLSESGQCVLSLNDRNNATLCLLANGKELITTEITSLQQFKKIVVNKSEGTENLPMWLTSETLITPKDKLISVSLRRGLARLDLKLCVSNVKVYEVEVNNIYDKSYLLPSSELSYPEKTSVYNLKKVWDTPLTESIEGLFYIFEQPTLHSQQEVVIRLDINGRFYTLREKLPQRIERNNIYTISVKGEGVNVSLDIEGDGWENGSDSDASLDGRVWIDSGSSQLVDNVTINQYNDTIKIGYIGTNEEEAIIALNASTSENVVIENSSDKEDVRLVEHEGKYRIHIKSSRRYIGSLENYVYVRNYNNDNVIQKQVVLRFEPNPIKVSGELFFDDCTNMSFTDYIDGTLGFFHLPEGYKIEVSAPAYKDDTAQWLKYSKIEDGSYRIFAGWRPNDKRAKGQPQSAVIKIYNTKGEVEEYSITRPNWNLPVVKIKDTWWCKYNLRGNVKSFKDQVSMEDDAKVGDNLATYLQSCNDEEFASLIGGQYQADNYNALKLTKNESGQLYYEGFTKTDKDFGSLPPTEMAPSGFQLPTYDDYRFFAWGNNCNLGYGSNKFGNQLQGDKSQRFTYTVFERPELKIGNIDYGPINFYDFHFENDASVQWVLLGLGHQYDDKVDKISKMYPLFAICDRTRAAWGVSGSTKTSNSGNWYKYESHNQYKTKTIRCIKSPVEFTY